jgi:uncharacterized 2Fe-2S/4Fe-4S cluster protein (DUF4445 family)
MPNLVKNTSIVDFEPIGRRVEVEPGTNLLDASRSAGIGLVSLCGGEGWCGNCQVRLVNGQLTPLNLLEEVELDPEAIVNGYRLACQAEPLSNVKIEIPASSLSAPQRLQLEGDELKIRLESAVTVVDVACPPPSLHDLRSDVTRLTQAMVEAGFDPPEIGMGVLADLSPRLRLSGWKARLAVCNGRLAVILPPKSQVFGLAVDIGTTKVAVFLMDLISGKTVEKIGVMNPQIAYGEDVISRISFTIEKSSGRNTMQKVLIDAFNEIVSEMCIRQSISSEQIIEGVFVGNTAMHHLFAGLPVEQLGLSPYVPAVSQSIDIPAALLGLKMAPEAQIHMLPNIAGYVGADHVAMLLGSGLWQKEGIALGVDIGTNTEISLVKDGKILSCSTASGPAFEGAHITNGMRAASGAIEHVKIIANEVHVFTIENHPPVGICGSGILDAIAEMRLAGIINEKGSLVSNHPLVCTEKGFPEFVLVSSENSGYSKEISLTRKDVYEIQLAKSAIRVGIDILLEEANIQADKIEDFVIAGAFGSYISVTSAVQIGMFPRIPLDRFHQVGNAAGIGARAALLSLTQRRLADEIAQRVRYIELTTDPRFQERFLKGLYL